MATIKFFDNEFQSGDGSWHCMNASDLANNSNAWWKFPRTMNMDLCDYIKLLINKFHVDQLEYLDSADVLLYSWRNQSDMRKFKNWANAEYRKHI